MEVSHRLLGGYSALSAFGFGLLCVNSFIFYRELTSNQALHLVSFTTAQREDGCIGGQRILMTHPKCNARRASRDGILTPCHGEI